MKHLINQEHWNRKEHFAFFSEFEEPFYGINVKIDCTHAYAAAKEKGQSFFLYYLYRSLKTVNEIENFKYRIIDQDVYLFDQIDVSCTIMREDGLFAYAHMDYYEDEEEFIRYANIEIAKVQQATTLMPSEYAVNEIHFSAIPWVDFSSISHARKFSRPDSSPKISFGKVVTADEKKWVSVSIHVHHGFVDGYHLGLFVNRLQELMNA
ncbi:chloramphenicol acetyltransferase [Belliella sp. DSM 111904]|uniref:Chloramphenicol acetyltransferase n=1 Tax=Belliella filtrata TaxID=2923435 RepID=A0ABS9V6N3_9BACT|nr:chloramphenicol acetyltransferase [Belliella filtrata]MCH7411610.1 chloramphenicol acetyltransferase [Belliella filtrata]